MPKDNIDYSETIIYKIYCKDESIKDVYVGHTTNFPVRKYQHKNTCNNDKNDLKIYKIIRENGGWNNWNMVEITKYNCKDSTEAKIKEQYHYELLNSSLNSCPPYVDNKKYFCVDCKLQYSGKKHYNNHINCKLHNKIMLNLRKQMPTLLVPKSLEKYFCKLCDYTTSRNSQYQRHLFTAKHIFQQKSTLLVPKSLEKYFCKLCDYTTSRNSQFQRHLLTAKHIFQQKSTLLVPKSSTCKCGKVFKDRTGLWKHSKICKIIEFEENGEPISKELVIQLIKQNQNLQDMLHDQHNKMFELAKEGKNITNNTTNNNHFNLNVFLNEQCKDAINLMDFVDSLNIRLKDLEYTASVGYAEGVSKIFIKALSDLNVHKRPIHCSDSKREILYIKDDGLWQKDDEDKSKLTKAIKIVGNKSMKQISEWQKVYPEYNDPESKQNDKYMKMICNVMSGSTKEEADKNYDKVIKNIAKEVTIDKNV